MKLKIQLVFFLLLALLSIQSFSYHTEEETGSYLLDELDFHKAIQENQYLFVNFHALWCRYSKKLKPEWAILSRTLLTNNSPIKLAKLEAYDEKRIAQEFEVDQFPTLKLFINGVPHTYYGERTEAGMLEFLDRKLKKDFTQVSDLQTITNKQKEYEWVGVLLSDYNNDAVKDVAFNMQEIFFARMELNAGRNLFNTNNGTFVLVNKVTNTNEVYDREITVDSLTAFINSKKYAPISRFCKGTAEKIFLSEDPAMILIVDKKVSISQPAEKAFVESQAKVQEITKMFMSIADFDDEITKLLVENIGLGQIDLPTVVIVRTDREKIRKYRISGVVTVDSITQFVRDYTNKKAERLYASEMNPPTTENAKNLVKKVVGVTFNEIVLNPQNDVLVLVWAPWCGHCRATFPIYDNVARKMREVDHFTVTKIDGSVNDLERFGLDIVEYPTILFFTKKDKKNPIEFRGERNEYAFNDFIRAHATVNLEKMKGPNPWDKNEL